MRKLRSVLALMACATMTTACQDRAQEYVLGRTGHGPDEWSRQRIQTLGVTGYIDEQLRPETIPDDAYDAIEATFPVLTRNYRQQMQDGVDTGDARRQLTHAKILRAIYSRRQLEAIMVDFWINHFSVYGGEGLAAPGIVPYERQHIEPYALGRFADLLLSVARSPAMLDYLDNNQNSRFGLNENYARELMELHTLGVDGPYSEADVLEVARVLTGWTTDYEGEDDPTGFRWEEDWHEPGDKVVLGTTIPEAGEAEGVQVLALLAAHPATAQYVSQRLAERFLGENPPPRVVNQMASKWLTTDGDLREVMGVLLHSAHFRIGYLTDDARTKRPLVFAASMARAVGASDSLDMANRFRRDLEDLGEDLYLARPPTGYPDEERYWAGNGAMLDRLNIAYDVARGRRDVDFDPVIQNDPAALVDAWLARLFVRPVGDHVRDPVIAYLEGLPNNVRDDPDRFSREALAMLLVSADFLSH